MIKVLHANDHYELVGGAEKVFFGLLGVLEERGVENVVVYQHSTSAPEKADRRAYQVPFLGDANVWQHSGTMERYQEILNQEKPDLIHLHDIGNPKVAEISLRFAPTVQGVYNHSFYCPGGQKYLPFRGKICNKRFGPGCIASAFLTHCNSIRPEVLFSSYLRSYRMLKSNRGLTFLVLSEFQAERLLENGCSRNRVKVFAPFAEVPAVDLTGRNSKGENALLFTGRVTRQKGLDLLLKSLEFLTSPYCLIVDGDGPYLSQAKKLAQELGIEKQVEFVGWTSGDKHHGYYEKARVVIVPSIWPEPFGLVGIEAMSCGKPVVAFNVGGIKDWLEDGVTGYLIEPYDIKKMAAKIDYLLSHPEMAQTLGLEARKRVTSKFGREEYARKILEIYHEAIQNFRI